MQGRGSCCFYYHLDSRTWFLRPWLAPVQVPGCVSGFHVCHRHCSPSFPPSKLAWRLPAQSLVLSDLGPCGADLSIPEASPKCQDPPRPLICPRLKGHHLQRFPFKAPALSALHSPASPFEVFPAGQVTICPTEGVSGHFLQSYRLLLWSSSLGDTPGGEGRGPRTCI